MESTDVIQPLPITQPVATQGTKNTIPQTATGTEYASIATGFPDITMQSLAEGGKPPHGQDFNGLFYLSTDQRVYLQNGGLITFNQAVSDAIGGYPSGAILDYIDSTGAYSKVKSLIENNTYNFVTTPGYIDGVNWQQLEVSSSALNSFLNNNQITNCILTAPNGVPTYSGNTVTVYESTNYLFPNGRNTDNTIKNVNFALASNATGSITGSVAGAYMVFVTSELELNFIPISNYYEGTIQPTELNTTTLDAMWYNPVTNILSFAAATASTPSWSSIQGALCATLVYSGSAITQFNPIYPIQLATQQDVEGVWVNTGSSSIVTGLTIGATSSTSVDITDYLPNDGNVYEVLLTGECTVSGAYNFSALLVSSSLSANCAFCSIQSGNTGTQSSGSIILPVGSDRIVTLRNGTSINALSSVSLYGLAYKRVRG